MVTGPYIGAAVIRGTGMTYEDLGTVKQVPTAEIFLALPPPWCCWPFRRLC